MDSKNSNNPLDYPVENLITLARHLLRSAILDYCSHRQESSVFLQKDAERWLFGDGKGPIDFQTVCDIINVSTLTVRRAIVEVRDDPSQLDLRLFNPEIV